MTKIKRKKMKKIIGKTCIWEKEEEKKENKIHGLLLKDKLVYKEKDVLVKVIPKAKEVEMIRSCDTYQLELFFERNQKRKGKYFLKKENISIDIYTVSKKVESTNQNIQIRYEVYIENEKTKENTWTLQYEVIE